jgi:hypothetical protein
MLTKKRGQVWVETVLYTLIGISLIALVLAFVTPKINEIKDRSLVEQSIASLNDLDGKINSVVQYSGNRRVYEPLIKKGDFTIYSDKDLITFELKDLTKPYSQPNVTTKYGSIGIYSLVGKKTSTATLTLNYSGFINLTYDGVEDNSPNKFTPSSTPYKFYVESGDVINGLRMISIKSES